MNTTLNTQLHTQLIQTSTQPDYDLNPISPTPIIRDHDDWVGAFNTSILTTLANSTPDCSQELARLAASPEFESLLIAAKHLAKSENLSPEDATERLIMMFRKIDATWNKIVMNRGLNALIGR